MITTNDLRHEIANILGFMIPENGWRQTFNELNGTGQPDHKSLVKMMVVILEHLDKLETK